MLIIQFGPGVELHVTLPQPKSFFPAVFGSATLAIVAILLLGAAIGGLVRAIRSRRRSCSPRPAWRRFLQPESPERHS